MERIAGSLEDFAAMHGNGLAQHRVVLAHRFLHRTAKVEPAQARASMSVNSSATRSARSSATAISPCRALRPRRHSSQSPWSGESSKQRPARGHRDPTHARALGAPCQNRACPIPMRPIPPRSSSTRPRASWRSRSPTGARSSCRTSSCASIRRRLKCAATGRPGSAADRQARRDDQRGRGGRALRDPAVFSDGHNTGIYSWDYLYGLGDDQEELWQDISTASRRPAQPRSGLR